MAQAVVPGRLRRKHEQADRIEAQLTARRCCRRCGRALRDPVNVAAGIGRECDRREHRP